MSNEANQPDNKEPRTPSLSADEARVLDALLASMSSPAKPYLAPEDAKHAARIAPLLDLIGQCPTCTPSPELVQRTLDRVADARRQTWFAIQAQALAAPRVGMGWNEVAAIAAMLLVSFSLLYPVIGTVRSDARKVACASNLESAGMALGHYASANNDRMPRRGTWPGEVWWNVGQQRKEGEPVRSNSAHLYTLVRGGYIAPESLNCPENKQAPRFMTLTMHDWPSAPAVSYSYQNQYSPEPLRMTKAAGTAALADKNPLFAMNAQRGETPQQPKYRAELSPVTPSAFHLNRGQNILVLHGGVRWSTKPLLPNGDNIWLAKGVTQYNGTETPTDESDSFLVP